MKKYGTVTLEKKSEFIQWPENCGDHCFSGASILRELATFMPG
jgi:hypothetical protein